MTKEERLQEIKLQDKIYKEFDKAMDAGWREFVNEVRAKNKKSNDRIFRLLNPDFVKDFKKLIKSIGHEYARVQIVRAPEGTCYMDKRYATIPEIWVVMKSYGSLYGGMSGSVCVKVTDNRWLKINYQD